MTFNPRTTSPSMSNKYFIHVSGGGYNKCIKIKGVQCLPNCVGYAYGRFMECVGKHECSLPMCNAEDWFAQAKKNGYKTGSKAKLGAVMCFRKGKVNNAKDGAGHVLIVEKINSDGSIVCSQSGYKSSRFWTTKFKKPYKLNGYVFQGFIYNPDVETETPPKPKVVELKVAQTYTISTKSGLNIRKSAKKTSKKLGAIPNGTKVKCLAVNGNWIKVKYNKITGWICCKEDSTFYVK